MYTGPGIFTRGVEGMTNGRHKQRGGADGKRKGIVRSCRETGKERGQGRIQLKHITHTHTHKKVQQ